MDAQEDKPMASLLMSAEMRVRTLIALTEELTAIFAEENASLAAGRPEELILYQDDKSRLAAAYQDSIRRIAADRAVLDDAGDPLLEELRTITCAFEQRAAEQHALLDRLQAQSANAVATAYFSGV